jgi:hypothetical protein
MRRKGRAPAFDLARRFARKGPALALRPYRGLSFACSFVRVCIPSRKSLCRNQALRQGRFPSSRKDSVL